MSQFIRCPSCGFCFGPYMEFIDKARRAKYSKHISEDKKLSAFDAEKLAMFPEALPPLEDILDACGIKLICCRMRVLTVMNFDELYKGSISLYTTGVSEEVTRDAVYENSD